MRKNLIKLFAVLSFVLFQCATNKSKESKIKKITLITKNQLNDPFQKTTVSSQLFDIDVKKDNIIEGKNGTVIIFPKDCFRDINGKLVKGKVSIELAEALSMEDMLFSNLTTTSKGELLETGGMIYINATKNGEQLKINKKNPIYVEIPTEEKKSNMMVYVGKRDKDGNMEWINPKKLENYLPTVDMNLLSFYPKGFEKEVEQSMPFKNYKITDKALKDSLYYSLAVSDGSELIKGLVSTDYNEAIYNPNQSILNSKYIDKSYVLSENGDENIIEENYCEGINPAIIKAIGHKKFQETLIATRAFEERLQAIFATCRNDILEIYIKNLDKNLWELDSMAMKALDNEKYLTVFNNFYQQKLTNVKNRPKHADILKKYYEKQLEKVEKQLNQEKKKVLKELDKKNKKAQKLADNYKKSLWKREKYRMEKYGFEWTNLGWVNVDKPVKNNTQIIKIPPQKLEVNIQNGENYDRVYTYVVYTSIKSLYRLNTKDNKSFYVGFENDKSMSMPYKSSAIVVSIAYKNKQAFLAFQSFQTHSGTSSINLSLKKSSNQDIKTTIQSYNTYKTENKISKDLAYLEQFTKEKKRQQQLKSEYEFMKKLWKKAYPCCDAITKIDSTFPE